MGKNRKLKQSVNHSQQPTGSEDEIYPEEAPEAFLTSDNFCVVQKKRNCKKLPEDHEDSSCLHKSRSNSVKFISEINHSEESGCHTSFWTNRYQDSLPHFTEHVEEYEDHTNLSDDKETAISADVEICASKSKKKEKIKCTKVDGQCQIGKNYHDLTPEAVSVGFAVSKPGFHLLCNNGSDEEMDVIDDSDGDAEVVNSDVEIENNAPEVSVNCNRTSKKCKKNKVTERKNQQISDTELEQLLKELELPEDRKDHVEGKGKNRGSKKVACCDMNSLSSNCEGKPKAKNQLKEHDNICEMNAASEVSDKENTNKCSESDIVEKEINHLQNDNSQEVHTVKTAAQKRKEKKARGKQKGFSKNEADSLLKKRESQESEANVLPKNPNLESGGLILPGKDMKLKTDNVEESEKKDRKRPSKKQLTVIREALKKAKEEEERHIKEEESRQRASEEAEKLRLEKLRSEQERKEKKKLKEKQRKERMKAEGRYLSKSQKQSRARMEATLAAFRQQGIAIPEVSEKKVHGPRLGNYKTSHRKRLDSSQSSDGLVTKTERHKTESLSSQESLGKDSLSDLPSSLDSKYSWDMNSVQDSAPTTESEMGRLSCSAESDILNEHNSRTYKTVELSLAKNVEASVQKAGLLKMETTSTEVTQSFAETIDKRKSVKLRSPVVCVLGHVDTGKTKLLDYIRKSHVQDGEAGGVTQQIGATMIPREAIKEKCKMVKDFSSFEVKVPGLLVIDTPGHESFANLRLRGSSVCDIAILVVDVMHGLEPQTIESINLLKKDKTPFVVALNKIDRIYGWKSVKNENIESVIQSQSPNTLMEFRKRCQDIVLQFAKECLNAVLFYENKDPRSYVSMVPTSAITGDGMGDILSLVVTLTQSLMHKKLIFSDVLQATVLEVKSIPGLGTTIDVILVNGCLHEGDTILFAGHDGPVVTQIRSLLMPQPLKELRVKNFYTEYKHVEGAQGVKVTGKDLDKAIAGLPLFVAQSQSKVDALKEEITHLFRNTMNSIKTSERGVYVQSSTLGSLEALLVFLDTANIPYFSVKIGPVVKKDVMKASIMLEHDRQYAAILAFDVKIERDAQELADTLGVHIFQADIIYHLFDKFTKYRDDLLQKRRDEIRQLAVFPCKLKILPGCVFSARDPIVLGVFVEAGMLREGTPLCVPSKENLEIGIVSQIEVNRKQVISAKKGQEARIKVDCKQGDSPKVYGKHFDHEDMLVSRITRQSINVCKEHCRDEQLQYCDWQLMVELKKLLHVV